MTDFGAYRVAEPPKLETCPHCGAATVTEQHALLRYVCGACGGPRIPGVGPSVLTAEARSELAHARRLASTQAALRLASVVLFVIGAAFAIFALARSTVPVAGMLAVFVGMTLRNFATRGDAACRRAVDEAWSRAATGVLAEEGRSMTPAELAQRMRVDVRDAESILARASAAGARVSVGDDAELRYRVDEDEGSKEMRK